MRVSNGKYSFHDSVLQHPPYVFFLSETGFDTSQTQLVNLNVDYVT
jgi:hypothetical protein